MKKLFLALIMVLMFASLSYAVGAVSISDAQALAGAGSISSVESPPVFTPPQNIYPYLLQQVPGEVKDVTDGMPTFKDIKPLQKTDPVVKAVHYSRGGRIAGFTRVDDVDEDLIALIPKAMKALGQNNLANIRYRLWLKPSNQAWGTGGGGGGSAQGISNSPIAWGGNGSVMPGTAVTTVNPRIVIKFFLIQP